MSLSIFAVNNKWYKNGLWWFTKVLNRIVGQERYEQTRISRRVLTNKFYYLRQQWLYRVFVQSPDIANLIGIYPKVNSAHGYGFYNSYEMYRDFQENTINSDGAFGMWIVYLAGAFIVHECYSYLFPYYWFKTAHCKNGEQQRLRLKDAIATTCLEETFGISIFEWGFAPHDSFLFRKKLADGLSHPDDIRAQNMSAVNRKHRYKEHYADKINGFSRKRMIGF